MGRKIECYLDIASYYSYMAFGHLQQSQELLRQNDVTVEFYPILIGAFNAATGNPPPWKTKVKARYLKHFDTPRAAAPLGLKNASAPGDLMIAGRTILPMRALTHIRNTFPREIYESALGYFFHAFWTLHKVPNDIPVLTAVLTEIPAAFRLECLAPLNTPPSSTATKGTLFTSEQVAMIVDACSKPEIKAALKARVDEALARGAFGAPWMWLTNARGETEPVFGSDRWAVVYEFLELPYQKLALLAPEKAKL